MCRQMGLLNEYAFQVNSAWGTDDDNGLEGMDGCSLDNNFGWYMVKLGEKVKLYIWGTLREPDV